MLKVSDAHHFRKTVAGACMILAPLVLLVAMIVHPERKSDEGAQLAVISGDLDAWFAAHLLALIAVALAIPAVLGLMHMLRDREVAYGHVGGGLALVGLLATIGLIAVEGFVGWQAARADVPAMTALFERTYDATGFVIPFLIVPLAFGLGGFVLAMGLYRARVVQSWMAALLALGSIGVVIAGPAYSGLLAVIGAALLLVGLGAIGKLVLEETDSEWEHTPEHRDFRPLAGMR